MLFAKGVVALAVLLTALEARFVPVEPSRLLTSNTTGKCGALHSACTPLLQLL